MKLLCIYDPAIILPVLYDWASVMDAVDAFAEHDQAQTFFGFKVIITEFIELTLASVSDGTPATAGGMAVTLLGYLTGPTRNQKFHVAEINEDCPAFVEQGNFLLAHSSDQIIQDIYEDLGYLLGWGQRDYPGKVRYASWRIDQGRGTHTELVGNQEERIPIIRSRYDWGEAYRQFRSHPANLLPNTFTLTPEGKVVFAFCPPEGFLEDEADLTRQALPRNMVEHHKWRGVNGYEDRWGNFWVFNPNRGHWDVQITEKIKKETGAPDHHLNVECAGRRAPSDDTSLEGCIEEGHQPDPGIMRRHFSIWTQE